MKRKRCIGIVIAIVLLTVIYFAVPRSFTRLFEKEGAFIVSRIDPDKLYETDFQWYYIDSDDKAFDRLMECLGDYRYHPNLRTVLTSITDSDLDGRKITVRYEWKEGSETQLIRITIGDAGYVKINDRLYRVGYWGKGKSEQLLEKVEEILADLEPVE